MNLSRIIRMHSHIFDHSYSSDEGELCCLPLERGLALRNEVQGCPANAKGSRRGSVLISVSSSDTSLLSPALTMWF